MKWYYYLHTNGELIGKNPVAVESDSEYFNSPFVKEFWKIDTTKREDAWRLLLEALALGASIEKVKELADKWKCNFEDSIEMLKRMKPTSLMKDGWYIFLKEILGFNSMDDYLIEVNRRK